MTDRKYTTLANTVWTLDKLAGTGCSRRGPISGHGQLRQGGRESHLQSGKCTFEDCGIGSGHNESTGACADLGWSKRSFLFTHRKEVLKDVERFDLEHREQVGQSVGLDGSSLMCGFLEACSSQHSVRVGLIDPVSHSGTFF